tara:strand:+ start:12 stop:140 length:129 start_codon:yes stop_codon:yes gene_type:complete
MEGCTAVAQVGANIKGDSAGLNERLVKTLKPALTARAPVNKQ